jgi:hypothetical protein
MPATRAALDPAAKVGMTVPVIVHATDPRTIQYAGGSIHFICQAINPWRNRTPRAGAMRATSARRPA